MPPAAPVRLIAALAEALEAIGAQWYLFGAQAVIVWGRPRLTADVDVTVFLQPEDPARLVARLEDAGFSLRVPPSVEFTTRTRVFPFLHHDTGLPLDLVLGGPGLEEQFLDRAVRVDLGGVVAPVISAEDLIVTKVLAGRPKDVDDVDGLLRERLDSLNLTSVDSTLALLEDALGQSDLVPVWRQALERVRKGVK